jgi:hypothetical protein
MVHPALPRSIRRTSMRVVPVKFGPFSYALMFFVPIEANLHRGRRAGPHKSGARAGGRSHERSRTSAGRAPITDESWRLRVCGADGSRATSVRAGGHASGHQRLIREAWKRAPLLHYGSQVNPVRLDGPRTSSLGRRSGVVPSDRHRFQLRAIRDHASLQIAPERD